jgi:hypothetical protein
MRLVFAVRMMGGGLPAVLGTASSGVVASVTEESVSILDARKGAKKLRVVTSLASAARSFDDGAASLVLWRFRLQSSLKPSFCVSFTDSIPVAVPRAELLDFNRDLRSFRATVCGVLGSVQGMSDQCVRPRAK